MDNMPADYKNSFDIIYDMMDNSVTTTVNTAAAVKVDALTQAVPNKVIVGSTYAIASRRCWIANLKVEVIGNAVAPTGITDTQAADKVAVKPVKRIQNGKLVIEKAGKFFDAVGKRIK